MVNSGNTSNMFINRAGDKITGMMKVSTSNDIYEIESLEGLGNGAGTVLFKQAIKDSIARGFGGSIYLSPKLQSLDWYLDHFPGSERLKNGLLYWSSEAAKAILEKK